MRIAIASDFHLGYDWGGERQEDSFEAAEEVLKRAVEKADALILAGDIFDTRTPKQEIIARAIRIFKGLKMRESEAKIVEVKKRNGKSISNPLALKGFPVITIYGTHERRTRGSVNPVELMEEAGYLVCLHGEVAILEKAGERVAIHGISGVPEIYARDVFRELRPRPVEGIKNIFMFHQSVKGFVYMDDDSPTLTLEDLPKGFDLIIDGHIHWANETKIGNTLFLIPGSTVTTQVRKTEAAIPKYMYYYDTLSGKLEKEELESPRKAFYIELDVTGRSGKEIKELVISSINEKLSFVDALEKIPLVRVVLKGVVNENVKAMGLEEIVKAFEGRAIVNMAKKLITKDEMEKRERFVEAVQSSETAESIFARVMQRRLRDVGLPQAFLDVIELLADGEIEKAESVAREAVRGPETREKLKDPEKSAAASDLLKEPEGKNSDSTLSRSEVGTALSDKTEENDGAENKVKNNEQKQTKMTGKLTDFI